MGEDASCNLCMIYSVYIKKEKEFNLSHVSIHFSLEKDSVVFSAFVNCNIMLCIEFSSLRLKCDMGEFF